MSKSEPEQLKRFEKMCRMTGALLKEMTEDERAVVLHLNMLEATGTVRDHPLISELVDRTAQRAVARLQGRHPEFV